MGTINKRENKHGITWQAKVRRSGHPGITRTFSTRENAEAWVAGIEADFEANKVIAEINAARRTIASAPDLLKVPFSFLLERYRNDITPTKKGRESEAARLTALQRSVLGTYRTGQLTRPVIAAWRDERLKVVSSGTVLRDLALLQTVIETARLEWGLELPTNPVQLIRKPRPNPARIRRLLPHEEQALFEAIHRPRGDYLEAVIVLALETAMRQSEIVGLDWKHIDLSARRVHLTVTKNGSTRGVPLSRKAIAVLKMRPERTGRVFPGLTTEAVKRAFIRACDRAGIEDFRFHDLRHEATSRFFEKGLAIMEVASITGHKSLSMLQRYTHLDAERLARKLD